MGSLGKFLKRCCLWCFLPVLLSVAIMLVIVIMPPKTEGLILHNRPGIGNVTIYRDNFSIPHIRGANEKDVLYGAGYAHASDRLWNMASKRRLIKGEISELAGPRTLTLDRFMRTVGIHRAATESAKVMPQEVRELVQAYVDGVNDYVATLRFLPLEFLLTFSSFEPWTVEDCVAQLKLMHFGLGSAWVSQMHRGFVADLVGRKKAKEWFPVYNTYDETLVIKDDELHLLGLYDKTLLERINSTEADEKVYNETLKKYATEPEYFKFLSNGYGLDELVMREVGPLMPFGGQVLGSNNWVISGKHTATGKPMLANDPHLNTAMPSIWYNIEYIYGKEGKEWVSGVGMPGIPFIILGRNAHVAWGVTTLVSDTTDLFEETLNEAQTHYLYEGQWYPLETIKEKIHVRFGETHEETIRITRHGPILPTFTQKQVPIARFSQEKPKPYALAWTGRIRNDTSFQGLKGIFEAKSVDDMTSAMRLMAINMNGVAADSKGHIGFAGMGRFIKRAHFENSAFIKNGSSAYDEWIGITGLEDVAVLKDPPKGYIVSANNRMASSAIKFGTTQAQYSTSRASRIEELIREKINAKEKITLQHMKAWQLDVVDVYERAEFPGLLKIAEAYKNKFNGIDVRKVDEALQLAKGFNGSLDRESLPALAMNVWEYKYYSRLFRRFNMTDNYRLALTNGYWMEQRHFSDWRRWNHNPENDSHLEYCMEPEDVETQKPACIYQIVKAFEETPDYIRKELGSDRSNWKWGSLHTIDYPHQPLSATPLKSIFHREYPGFGNKRTVNVAMYQLENNFKGIHTANYRLVASLDESQESYYSIDSGISGNAFSKHYDDQQKLHQKGEYIRMTFGKESLGNYTEKLELRPTRA